MNETWYTSNSLRKTDSSEISGDFTVGSASPWYEGHFPERPILPGIAQLAIVLDAIKKQSFPDADDLEIAGFKRVRFRKIIQPDEEIKLKAIQDKKNPLHFKFKILTKEEIACNGIILVKKVNCT